jgi:hypothetical protein
MVKRKMSDEVIADPVLSTPHACQRDAAAGALHSNGQLHRIKLDRFVFGPAAIEPEVSTGRDYASRLRYEAQDLAQDLRRQARLKKGGSDLGIKQTDHVLDEIEAITTDLDSLLARIDSSGAP